MRIGIFLHMVGTVATTVLYTLGPFPIPYLIYVYLDENNTGWQTAKECCHKHVIVCNYIIGIPHVR